MSTTTEIDESRLDQTTERLVQVLNDGALALMISLGHRTGLFPALASHGPVTSQGLADAAGLQERYVREWLGAMTVGRIAGHDPDAGTYWLDAEHAAPLTDRGPFNLAATAMFVPVLAGVEDELVECFREGGGVPYEAFPRFHEVMEADSAQTVLAALEDAILPLVPGLTERLGAGIDVLDVGCGRGRALQQLARTFPASRFTGLDLSPEAIAHAERASADLPNLGYRVGDATRLVDQWPAGSFDLVTTFDAVHDQAHPAAMLSGIHDLLREGGTYLAQDINASGSHHGDLDHPMGPFLYTISCMHCMTVSLAQGGDGLGAAWGRPMAERMLREAGFASVGAHALPHDEQNLYYVCR
jgi:SAM-dependent methyltransferase